MAVSTMRLGLVTGMHRSGTTFVGKAVGEVPEATYIHEPFNPRYGLARVPAEYPYVTEVPDPVTTTVLDLIDSVAVLRGRFRRRHPRDGRIKGAARLIVGGEAGRSQWLARVRRLQGRETLVVKDPYLLLALPGLLDLIDDGTGAVSQRVWAEHFRAVCLVRHPMAIWRSIQRMGWGVRLGDLGGPAFAERLATEGLPDLPALDRRPPVEKAGYLWRLLYRDALASDSARLLTMKHETVSVSPLGAFENIAGHFGLDLDERSRHRIVERTSGSVVAAEPGRLHELKRDAQGLAWSWTESPPDADEATLHEITGDLVEGFYGFWRP